MVASAKRGKGNAKSYAPHGSGYFSNTSYFSELTQEQIMRKVVSYMSRHPEFMQELELKVLEEEHPELVQRNINYLMRKSIDGPKNLNDQDLEYVTKEFTNNFLFKDKSKRNFMEKTAEGSLKLLLKNYLSDL